MATARVGEMMSRGSPAVVTVIREWKMSDQKCSVSCPVSTSVITLNTFRCQHHPWILMIARRIKRRKKLFLALKGYGTFMFA